MKRPARHLSIAVAFVLGCGLTAIVAMATAPMEAQAGEGGYILVCADAGGVLRVIAPTATCPAGQRTIVLKKADSDLDIDTPKDKDGKDASPVDAQRLEELTRRVAKLEEMGCAAVSKNKVVAPFQVLNRSGKTVFYVGDGIAELFNGAEESVARIDAGSDGGRFLAMSSSGSITAALGPTGKGFGLYIREGGEQRVELARRPAGNYSLIFSKGDKKIAALGVTTEGSGQAVVADASGTAKVVMNVGVSDNKGRVYITRGGNDTLAALAEGDHGGGVMVLCKSEGCNPPMVDAGDAGGYGLVRTGPLGFNPGLGLVGTPGSFLMGKKQ